MASTPVTAPGMSISAAGAGGVLTGDASGFGGLFASMVDDAAPVVPLGNGSIAMATATEPAPGEGMISVLLGVRSGNGKAVDPAAALKLGGVFNIQNTVETEVRLGDAPALTVTGDADAVAAFVAQVQEVVKQITQDGKLTMGQLRDTKELASALTDMGMEPEEALGVAERIQTMLKLIEQQQEVDDETAGSLVAMMLAIMGQSAQPAPAADGKTPDAVPQLGLQIISVEDVPVQASAQRTGKMTSWQVRANGDVTRDLLGLETPKEKAPAVPAATEPVKKVEVVVTVDPEASVGVAMPEVKVQSIPAKDVAVDAKPSDAAQAAAAVTTGTATRVAAQDVVEAPKGETYYKLQADKHGVETLDAVKPAGEVREGTMTLGQATAQPAHAAAAATAAVASEAAAFAERVAQINEMMDKAQVGKQVAVQMIPLLEQGGGTIRMNLNPGNLGQVTVELQVADGKVHGSIAASEPAVVEQLARELHTLRHGLADAGLKLGEQGINLMLSNSGHQDQQQGQPKGNGQAQKGFGEGRNAGEDAGLTTNLAGWVSPDRVLDVNV